MIVMERKVFLACLIAIMISALVVPVNQAAADEPANLVKLTPFSISFLEKDFDKFALVHPILLLETGSSANVRIRIQNNDVQDTHEIKFHINFGDPSMAQRVTISFDRQSVTLSPNAFAEVLMHINAKSNLNETYYSSVGIAAYGTTFGAVGKAFYLVVGNNVTEFDTSYLDLYIREGLPGNYFNLDQNTSRAHIEELWGERIYLPSYLPDNYELKGVDGAEWGVRLVYSTFEITNKTDLTEFWRNHGMLILYNNNPLDFDEYLLPWIAYSEGQEIMVNDFVGTALEQKDRVTISGTKFKSPSVLHLFKDDFNIELMATLSLDELLKVAASMNYQEQSQAPNAQDFTFRPAINLTENGNGLSPQVAASGNNVYVLWGAGRSSFFRSSIDSGATFGHAIKLEIAGQKMDAFGNDVYVVGLRQGKISLTSSNDNGASFEPPVDLGAGSIPDMEAFGRNVYVVWQQAHQSIGSQDWESEVLFRASRDNGITFDEEIDLSNNDGKSTDPKVAVSGSNVYVIWEEDTNLDGDTDEIFFRASNNSGLSFADTVNLSLDSSRSLDPLIAASSSDVYVLWEDVPKSDLLFRASRDNGATFDDVISLTEDLESASDPQITASGNNVYVAWNSHNKLFFRTGNDNGRTFSDTIRLSDEVGPQGLQWQPKIVLSGRNVHVLWTDELDVFFTTSNDNGSVFDGIVGLTGEDGSGSKGGIDLAVSENNVYAVWHDLTKEGWKILFRASSPYAFAGTVSERGCKEIGGTMVKDWIDSQHTKQVELCKYNDEYFRIRDLEGLSCEDEVKWAKDPKTQRVLEFGSPCHVPSTWIVCGQGPGVLSRSQDEIVVNLITDCDKNFAISVAGSVDDPNMQFDREMKRLIVVLRTKQLTPVNITLPRELLDGPYSVKMTQQHHVGKIKGEWVVNQNTTHASFFRELKQDITTIEITGTTAIPEFPMQHLTKPTPSGTIFVDLYWEPDIIEANKTTAFVVAFRDDKNNTIKDTRYDILVTDAKGTVVLQKKFLATVDGRGTHEVTFESAGNVHITITYHHPLGTGFLAEPFDEKVEFDLMVVPEFPVNLMVIAAIGLMGVLIILRLKGLEKCSGEKDEIVSTTSC